MGLQFLLESKSLTDKMFSLAERHSGWKYSVVIEPLRPKPPLVSVYIHVCCLLSCCDFLNLPSALPWGLIGFCEQNQSYPLIVTVLMGVAGG